MQVTVKGKQLDVGDSLRTHVKDTLSALVGKYFGNPMEATVILSRDAHLYKADIQVHVGRGILLQSNAEATEPYPAFDEAADRVAKRLRRYKRRLKDHHNRATVADLPVTPARKYIIEAAADEADTLDDSGEDTAEALNGDAHQPIVVAEMQTNIEMLTVSEAVMRMDLADLPALMFRNRAHGGLNMIYRRPDGNVGWVDPTGAVPAARP
ncbi:ribosome-associated translation inhibitor RaiA [Aerophototrophica crusticola]|uniref:Ribosome hibernation promoting factor n=1 Tax=Aerophototrophica crusticola TaxID=1709002 RepID=A0A858R3M4_9PROT|nr:ribosome-associated translation inhibitor RaiA [Rhodospirillaceae bacterium B3]